MLQWLYTYVVNVCSQCFICFFRRMLQVCLSRCCISFTHMLQVFYLDVMYVCNDFQVFLSVFASFSNACFMCFICHLLYVTSVASGCFKSRSGIAHEMRVVRSATGPRAARAHETRAWAGDVWVARPPCGRVKRGCGYELQLRRPGASSAVNEKQIIGVLFLM